MQKTILIILFFAACSVHAQVAKEERPVTHKPVLTSVQSNQIPLEEQIQRLEVKKVKIASQYGPESPEMQKVNLMLEQKKALLEEQKRKQNAKAVRH
ncbi:MAG: hypothetical protein K1X92_13485 [Bacteroidia bacterium]|nr:hypothetical protein [Bacteroidia bacterium]